MMLADIGDQSACIYDMQWNGPSSGPPPFSAPYLLYCIVNHLLYTYKLTDRRRVA